MAILNTRLTDTSRKTVYSSVGNNAITTMIVCNTGNIDLEDELVNQASLTIYAIPLGQAAGDITTIVKNLIIPAGETVFFSDEKIILSTGDLIEAVSTVGNLITITVSTLTV
jgi:hypothetical protein